MKRHKPIFRGKVMDECSVCVRRDAVMWIGVRAWRCRFCKAGRILEGTP